MAKIDSENSYSVGVKNIYMRRKIKSAIGISISLLLIWLIFKGTNWSEFLKAIQNINYFIIIAAMAIMVFSVWIRAIRWRILISKVGNVSTKDLYKVTMVGYMGNNILPLKMGELLRAYAISKRMYEVTISASQMRNLFIFLNHNR